jgi:hypothetical protein
MQHQSTVVTSTRRRQQCLASWISGDAANDGHVQNQQRLSVYAHQFTLISLHLSVYSYDATSEPLPSSSSFATHSKTVACPLCCHASSQHHCVMGLVVTWLHSLNLTSNKNVQKQEMTCLKHTCFNNLSPTLRVLATEHT